MKIVRQFPHRVRLTEHTWITMPDGVRLSARLWVPEAADENPVPAVLEYIPYRHNDLTRKRDSIHSPYLAGHGLAYVRVDIRGCGNSEGYITDEYTEAELADGERVIEWIARQPWCNGNVGMMGISWGGFNALQIAARQPPALKAIITACSTDDTYRDNIHFMGGCLLGDNLSEATTMFAYQTCPPDPRIVGDAWRQMWLERLENHEPWLIPWLENATRNEAWKRTSVCENYDAIQCPVMAISGWADGFSNAVFRLVDRLSVPAVGLIGPWSHKYPHEGVPGPAIGFLQEARRWFGQWLGGEDHDVENDPPLRVWMQESVPPQYQAYRQRPGRWVAFNPWPSPRIKKRRFAFAHYYLSLRSERHDQASPRWVRSPLSVGLHAGKWCSYAAAPDHPGDQREEDGGSLVFESAQLPEPLEAVGTPAVELTVSADEPVAQVAVRLSDVRPNGEATRVTYGLLNLTHRRSHEHPEPLVPGQPVTVRVPLNGIAQRFPKGHRLRVSISTSYWPMAWPPPRPATVTIHPANSALVLPICPPAEQKAAAEPFEAPEGAQPAPTTFLRSPRQNWRVIRDLAEGTAMLEVTRHDVEQRFDEIDLAVKQKTLELYSSHADTYATLRGETRTERAFSRGDWITSIRTRTVLTSDDRAMYLHATIDAYEQDQRIFSRTWTRRIDRQLY